MNFTGLLVGLSTFLIIGLFHPLVIKAEYYLGVKSRIIFAIAGLIFGIASVMVSHLILSTILGGIGYFDRKILGESGILVNKISGESGNIFVSC